MAEVQEIVEQEAEVLLEDLINAAMEDGELSPDEETHLTATAKHFGLDLNKSENNRIWLEMGRICFLLNNCSADEYPVVEAPFSLQAREVCYATEDFEWMSVKTSRSKTSPGVRIDTLGDASVYLTSKRILFVGAIESKTARNTSISSIQRYRDGVLVVRNTSPSYFLKYKSQDHEVQGTALLLERLILPDTQKVRASIPMSCFLVPPSNEIIEADLIDDYPADEYHVGSGPRFTFRVVGTHVENRQAIANQLRLEEQLFLVREPTNPYDANAVAVLSKDQQHIGYLKREVAEWFGPKMDRGYSFVSSVYRKRDDAAIIAGVYET